MSELTIHMFPCLADNYGYLLHDAESGTTAAVDTPDARAIAATFCGSSMTRSGSGRRGARSRVTSSRRAVFSTGRLGIAMSKVGCASAASRGRRQTGSAISYRRPPADR